jgi:hypothetical protein
MAVTRRLDMVFQNQAGRAVRIGVPNPKQDLTQAQIGAAMDTIINRNIFTTTGGNLVQKLRARIVVQDVTQYEWGF